MPDHNHRLIGLRYDLERQVIDGESLGLTGTRQAALMGVVVDPDGGGTREVIGDPGRFALLEDDLHAALDQPGTWVLVNWTRAELKALRARLTAGMRPEGTTPGGLILAPR